MKKILLICVSIIAAAFIFAEDTQPDDKKTKDEAKVNLIDHDEAVGAEFALNGNNKTFDPSVSGYLDFSAEYDKKIKVSIDLDADKTKVQADSISIRYRLNEFSFSADYRKEKFFADDLLTSKERTLSGKSLTAQILDDAGYAQRATGLSFAYQGKKAQSQIKQLGIRASYDGSFPVLLNGGFALRMINNDSWFGVTGTIAAPTFRGYGSGFMHFDTGSLLAYAQCGGGSYLTALTDISINGNLSPMPVWGFADAGVGYRFQIADNPIEIWILGSYNVPAFTQPANFGGTALLGGKAILSKDIALRAFGGMDYDRNQNIIKIKPDFRISSSVKM